MADKMLIWVVVATVIGVVITILVRKSQEMSNPRAKKAA